MQALRQFIEVKNNSFNVSLPENFKAKNVEIIIIPCENKIISKETRNLLDNRLNEYIKNPNKTSDFDTLLQELEVL